MQMDRLTIKSQEALQAAQARAREMAHAEVDGEHLLLALLHQSEGLIQPLLQKLGASPRALAADVESELFRRAKVQGGAEASLSANLRKTLEAAQTEAGKL